MAGAEGVLEQPFLKPLSIIGPFGRIMGGGNTAPFCFSGAKNGGGE
jgi:hypothetical protein